MAEVLQWHVFARPDFANGRPAWRRASRPDGGRPARRRGTAFREGGPHGGGGFTEPRRASERGLAMGGGRPAERRFTVGGSGKYVGSVPRTVLAYWKFESISLQQTVRLSPELARRGREPRPFARVCGPWEVVRSAETGIGRRHGA